MADKYIYQNGGTLTEREAIQTSGGVPSAGKIPALDPSGKLDTSMMPTGIGAETAAIQATEALSAGDFVNIYNVAGAARMRKADASTSGKQADGFVLAAVASGATGAAYLRGANTQVSGQTPGIVFLSATTPGAATSIAPSGAGQTVQKLGVATAAASINFQKGEPIVLA